MDNENGHEHEHEQEHEHENENEHKNEHQDAQGTTIDDMLSLLAHTVQHSRTDGRAITDKLADLGMHTFESGRTKRYAWPESAETVTSVKDILKKIAQQKPHLIREIYAVVPPPRTRRRPRSQQLPRSGRPRSGRSGRSGRASDEEDGKYSVDEEDDGGEYGEYDGEQEEEQEEEHEQVDEDEGEEDADGGAAAAAAGANSSRRTRRRTGDAKEMSYLDILSAAAAAADAAALGDEGIDDDRLGRLMRSAVDGLDESRMDAAPLAALLAARPPGLAEALAAVDAGFPADVERLRRLHDAARNARLERNALIRHAMQMILMTEVGASFFSLASSHPGNNQPLSSFMPSRCRPGRRPGSSWAATIATSASTSGSWTRTAS